MTPTYRRGWWWAAYVNDDYQVSKNLTLNLGVRYQIQQPLIEKYDHIAELDFATGKQRFAGKDGVPRGLYPTDKNDWAPRVGLKVSGLTALRDDDISCMSRKDLSIADYAARNIDSRTCARAINRRLR